MIPRARVLAGWCAFLLAFPVAWLTMLLTRSPERTRGVAARWLAGPVCRALGLDVRLEGLEGIRGLGPAVFVGNHQSHLDQVILAKLFLEVPDLRIFAKLYGVWAHPALARPFQWTGNFVSGAGDIAKNVKALFRARGALRRGLSLGLYPEGRRQRRADRLGIFLPGGFQLAIENQVPIVPVIVSPLRPDVDLEGWHIVPSTIRVRILDPVPSSGLGRDDVDAFVSAVRAQMQEVVDRDYVGVAHVPEGQFTGGPDPTADLVQELESAPPAHPREETR